MRRELLKCQSTRIKLNLSHWLLFWFATMLWLQFHARLQWPTPRPSDWFIVLKLSPVTSGLAQKKIGFDIQNCSLKCATLSNHIGCHKDQSMGWKDEKIEATVRLNIDLGLELGHFSSSMKNVFMTYFTTAQNWYPNGCYLLRWLCSCAKSDTCHLCCHLFSVTWSF